MNNSEMAFEAIKKHGIPDQFQKFGMTLSMGGALSTFLVAAITESRINPDDSSFKERVRELFAKMLANLANARKILADLMVEYDQKGLWTSLDNSVRTLNIGQMLATLAPDFEFHGFRVVLQSLRYNWEFMKAEGTRAFYQMTDVYLTNLEQLALDAKSRFEVETRSGIVDIYWLIKLDLNMVEVPTHCDVCRFTMGMVMAHRQDYQALVTDSRTKGVGATADIRP